MLDKAKIGRGSIDWKKSPNIGLLKKMQEDFEHSFMGVADSLWI